MKNIFALVFLFAIATITFAGPLSEAKPNYSFNKGSTEIVVTNNDVVLEDCFVVSSPHVLGRLDFGICEVKNDFVENSKSVKANQGFLDEIEYPPLKNCLNSKTHLAFQNYNVDYLKPISFYSC
jgi:hypothetical protein